MAMVIWCYLTKQYFITNKILNIIGLDNSQLGGMTLNTVFGGQFQTRYFPREINKL